MFDILLRDELWKAKTKSVMTKKLVKKYKRNTSPAGHKKKYWKLI